MNASETRHTIFKTRWGHFGFICRDDSICRTLLPVGKRTTAREALLANQMPCPADVPYEKDLQRGLQQRIIAYFEGENIDFSTDPAVDLTGFTVFQQAVLTACRRIGPGWTRTYGELAADAGHAKAARAVGGAMARNPVPLIVPCHRVVQASGGLGGFSAIGGTTLKQRMLLHENPL